MPNDMMSVRRGRQELQAGVERLEKLWDNMVDKHLNAPPKPRSTAGIAGGVLTHVAILCFTVLIVWTAQPSSSLFSWHPTLMSIAVRSFWLPMAIVLRCKLCCSLCYLCLRQYCCLLCGPLLCTGIQGLARSSGTGYCRPAVFSVRTQDWLSSLLTRFKLESSTIPHGMGWRASPSVGVYQPKQRVALPSCGLVFYPSK
ncbi:hypothetical protein GBAR_LOCUS31663 [Geodia barretti]|uniref:Uncharacterized protein n=1 Tax=Geodia barretti TaxID=519541 RepID=A0AA35U3N6_GEOBA|nr:hypothetical protein GBAR_LOCUS31663 [Geodia barretti]